VAFCLTFFCLITLYFNPGSNGEKPVSGIFRSLGILPIKGWIGCTGLCKNVKQRSGCSKLTLAELEAGTCTRLTGLLPFDLAGIAGEETFGLESGTVSLSVEIAQGAGYSEPDSLGLAFGTTTDDIHLHVKLTFSLCDGERLVHDVLERAALEVVFEGAVIDRDVASTGRKVNTSDG